MPDCFPLSRQQADEGGRKEENRKASGLLRTLVHKSKEFPARICVVGSERPPGRPCGPKGSSDIGKQSLSVPQNGSQTRITSERNCDTMKNKSLRSVAALALVLVFSVTALVGCGADKKQASAASQPNISQAATNGGSTARKTENKKPAKKTEKKPAKKTAAKKAEAKAKEQAAGTEAGAAANSAGKTNNAKPAGQAAGSQKPGKQTANTQTPDTNAAAQQSDNGAAKTENTAPAA